MRHGDGERGGENEVVWLELIVSAHGVFLPIEGRVSFSSTKSNVNVLPAVDEGAGLKDEFSNYFEAGGDVFEVKEGGGICCLPSRRTQVIRCEGDV